MLNLTSKLFLVATICLIGLSSQAGPGLGCQSSTKDIFAEKSYFGFTPEVSLEADKLIIGQLFTARCSTSAPSIEPMVLEFTIDTNEHPELKGADKAVIIVQGITLEETREVEFLLHNQKGVLKASIIRAWAPQSANIEDIFATFKGETTSYLLLTIEKQGKVLKVFGEDEI